MTEMSSRLTLIQKNSTSDHTKKSPRNIIVRAIDSDEDAGDIALLVLKRAFAEPVVEGGIAAGERSAIVRLAQRLEGEVHVLSVELVVAA